MCGVRLGSSFTAHLPTWYAFLAADERRLCVWVSSWTLHARLWSVCALEPVSCSLHSCSFMICLIAWYGKSSHFWSSWRDFGSLPSNYMLESLCQFSQKKCLNFKQIKSVDQLGEKWNFYNIKSLNPWLSDGFLHLLRFLYFSSLLVFCTVVWVFFIRFILGYLMFWCYDVIFLKLYSVLFIEL